MAAHDRRPGTPDRFLLAVAAPAEVRAVLRGLGSARSDDAPAWTARACPGPFDLIETGVGKGCAAGGVAHCFHPTRHVGVISLGIAGVLPGSDATIGTVILASSSVYADEGASTPSGFVDIASMGFGPDPHRAVIRVECDAFLREQLTPVADRVGGVATVSTCSGTDELAHEVTQRTGAIAEAMEGAAVGFTVRRLGLATGASPAFAELRVISNTTGDRARQVWDLPRALSRLEQLGSQLLALLS